MLDLKTNLKFGSYINLNGSPIWCIVVEILGLLRKSGVWEGEQLGFDRLGSGIDINDEINILSPR